MYYAKESELNVDERNTKNLTVNQSINPAWIWLVNGAVPVEGMCSTVA